MESLKFNSIFRQLWEHDNIQIGTIKTYITPSHKLMFWVMFICLVLAVLTALTTNIEEYDWQKPASLFFICCSLIVGILQQLSFIFKAFKQFKDPTRLFLEPIAESASKDYTLAIALSKYSKSQLVYAKELLSLEIIHLKSRVNILIGAVEKVGIIPVLISWLFAVDGYISEDIVTFKHIDWIVFALLGLYLITLSIILQGHKLEKHQLLINSAVEIKITKSISRDTQKTSIRHI